MTNRVCYLRRSDRGSRVSGVTLLGAHTCDEWDASKNGDTDHAVQGIQDAARWIKERLTTGSEKTRLISTLCLDTDGAVCSWVKPEEADAELLRAAIEQSGEIDHDEFDAPEISGASERFPDLPLEVSYEPLKGSPTSVGSRTAVLATPDVPARLLIDQLDTMGIRIGSITTLWHAIAIAWDPGARNSSSHDAQRIVASSAPVTACMVVDPDKSLIIWSWSQSGALIAGGTVRLPRIGGESHDAGVLTEPGIARIGADWLGWSSQLGVSPSRIHFITPRPSGDDPTNVPVALDSAGIGNALSRAWPGASIDLIEHDDPIGETLRKLAQSEPTPALTTLSARPGRAHRSMYRWSAAALLIASVGLATGAWNFFDRASDTRDRTRALLNEQRTLLEEDHPTVAISPFPLGELQNKVTVLRATAEPEIDEVDKPVMIELETISLVIGTPGISIRSIVINSFGATVVVSAENIEVAEQLAESLNQIGGSALDWRSPNYTRDGDRIEASYKSLWNDEELSS